jgi:hypothetical protein
VRPVHTFASTLWEHDGNAAWHFLSLPDDLSDDLEQRHGHHAAGFGSLRVEVTIGDTTWRTSLFPDSKRKTYVLPVKKQVRVAEGLADGSPVEVRLRVLV